MSNRMQVSLALRQLPAAVGNAVVGVNLASLRLLGNPGRFIDYVNESMFLNRSFVRSRGLAEKNVWEVIPPAPSFVSTLVLGNLRTDETWFYLSSYAVDLVNLVALCRLLRPRVVFEIGTLTGYTAYHFALNTSDEARVYTLDLPLNSAADPILKIDHSDVGFVRSRQQRRAYCFTNTAVASKIFPLSGDSATFEYSPFHGSVDLFFIDGAHSYEYVRSDTSNALACCHPGSAIAWHDYGRVGTGVERYLRELARTMEIFVVPGGSLAFAIVT